MIILLIIITIISLAINFFLYYKLNSFDQKILKIDNVGIKHYVVYYKLKNYKSETESESESENKIISDLDKIMQTYQNKTPSCLIKTL